VKLTFGFYNVNEEYMDGSGRKTWRTSAGGVCQAPNYSIFSDESCSWASRPIEDQEPGTAGG
jgi:hypothetical protein